MTYTLQESVVESNRSGETAACEDCKTPHHPDDIGTVCRTCRRGIVAPVD